MQERNARDILRDFLIELIFYSFIVVAYFFVVLQFLGDWLNQLFESNLVLYAFVSLGLILAQGAFFGSGDHFFC